MISFCFWRGVIEGHCRRWRVTDVAERSSLSLIKGHLHSYRLWHQIWLCKSARDWAVLKCKGHVQTGQGTDTGGLDLKNT